MKKLYQSNVDRVIAGVCGGIGEFFGVDPLLIRIILFLSGGGFGIYILLWIFVPLNPNPSR